MTSTTQATTSAGTPTYAKRKARALIGWLSEQEGALWISGREMQSSPDPAHVETCRRARDSVASRKPGVDQSNLFETHPPELEAHLAALRADPESEQILATSGTPMLVDLRRVCAAQPQIHIEDALKRAASVEAADVLALAKLTLPLPSREPIPVIFDQFKNAWLLSSPDPNLRVMGHFSNSVGPGFAGFGFAIAQMKSYMQIAGVKGRYFLRDGYYRAYGLLAAGITKVPALVKEFDSFEHVEMPQGLLPPSAYLGDRPPMLPDYLDDQVAVDTYLPVTTRMIVVQALELNSIG